MKAFKLMKKWLTGHILILALLFLASKGVYAQWSENSTENDSVAVTSGNQTKPAIVRDGRDGAIVVWEDDRNSSTGPDIYVGRIHASGTLSWTANGQPVAEVQRNQKSPRIVEDGEGGAFITWQDDRDFETFFNVYAQRIDHTFGQGQWQENGVLIQAGNNILPGIIRNSIFGVFIGSYSSFQTDFLIYLQKVNNDGVTQWLPFTRPSLGVRAAQPANPPTMISDFSDGMIIVWADRRSAAIEPELYAARLDNSGSPAWSPAEVLVDSLISGGTEPVIIPDGSGGAIVAYVTPEEVGATNDIVRVRNLDSEGAIQWTQTVSSSTGRKRNVKMVQANESTIFVFWEDLGSGADWDISARRIDFDGAIQGLEIDVVNAPGNQINPAVIENKRGRIIVAWQDDRSPNTDTDIYAQMLAANGNIQWDANGLAVSSAPNLQLSPALTDDGLGGAIIVWQDFRSALNFDVYAQRVSEPGVLGEFRNISVNVPVGGENWETGSTQTIAWGWRGEIDSVSIELSRNGGRNYFPEDIISPKAPNSGAFSFEVTGPASTECKIRIRAIGAEHILDQNETNFVISDSAGPVIAIRDTVREAASDQAVQVSAKAQDNSGIQGMFLNVRKGGDRDFEVEEMTAVTEDSFVVTIPARFVTERGVQYFISSQDNIGIVSKSEVFSIMVSFVGNVQRQQISRGSSQNSYRMVASPNRLTQTLADSIFAASGFPPYDTTSWRLFEFRNNANVERDSLNRNTFVFVPGQAYWLISSTNRVVNFGGGVSLNPAQNYTFAISPGWNQIGNPFAFAVSWDSIMVASGNPNVADPFLYEGSYQMVDVLQPYKGYFVLNRGTAVTLTVPPIASQGSGAASKIAAGNGWQIQLDARCQEARDHFNFLGVESEADQQWDAYDHPEPPPIGEYVSLYFPKRDWVINPNRYTTDIRSQIGAGQIWDFEVESNIASAEIEIELRGLESTPENLEIWLLDEKLNIRQDIRENRVYRFPTGGHGIRKALKLLIGPASFVTSELPESNFVPEDFELAQNFPNPFNPVTSIRFGLPQSESVRLVVYDLLGRQVRTLVNDEPFVAGFHIISWNGRDDHGSQVASGLYVYRIQAGEFSETRKMLLVR